jgi:hypothetical protein
MHSFPEARLSLNMHVNLFDKMARQIFSEARKSELSRTTRVALITYDGRWPEIRYSMKPHRSHSGSRADPVPFFYTRLDLASSSSAPIPVSRYSRTDIQRYNVIMIA